MSRFIITCSFYNGLFCFSSLHRRCTVVLRCVCLNLSLKDGSGRYEYTVSNILRNPFGIRSTNKLIIILIIMCIKQFPNNFTNNIRMHSLVHEPRYVASILFSLKLFVQTSPPLLPYAPPASTFCKPNVN